MTTLYWLLEYGKVLFVYFLVMFIWPELVFRKYLKGKRVSFHIAFTSTVMTVLINTVVLFFGLFHILKPWVIGVLFYGALLVCLVKKAPSREFLYNKLLKILRGTYGLKRMFSDIGKNLKDKANKEFLNLKDKHEGRWFEYILLGVIILFGAIYFGYGPLHDFSYGCGDIYVHHSWTYQLQQGHIFSAGVYPEAMHCVLYVFASIFGIKLYSCMLFVGAVHVMVTLAAAYIFLREVFAWRYTPHFVLTLYLILDVVNPYMGVAYARMQWTLPQEFGFPAVFFCAAFLLRYLRTTTDGLFKEKELKPVWEKTVKKLAFNDNIVIFALALCASITVHFYATIMAFFVCLAFVPSLLKKIFKPARLCTLITAVVAAVFVAALPMAGALASGMHFQGSIGWAMEVIKGTDENSLIQAQQHALTQSQATSMTREEAEAYAQSMKTEDGSTPNVLAFADGTVIYIDQLESAKKPFILFRPFIAIFNKVRTIYTDSIMVLFGDIRAVVITVFALFGVGIHFYCRFTMMDDEYNEDRDEDDEEAPAKRYYFGLVLAAFIYLSMYCARALGLPNLVDGERLCFLIQFLTVSMYFIPVDFALSMLKVVPVTVMKGIALAGVLVLYIGVRISGAFHGYLYYELSRFNGAVMATNGIIRDVPQNHFTIVSTVDEIYPIIGEGFHEELITFINSTVDEKYTLPTDYVFLFLEKKPLLRSQFHSYNGPAWLANEDKPIHKGLNNASVGDDLITSEISLELAKQPYVKLNPTSRVYQMLDQRSILESRMLEWCNRFEALYPGELHTYYEDEYFACYYFKQNPACLYQLGVYYADVK